MPPDRDLKTGESESQSRVDTARVSLDEAQSITMARRLQYSSLQNSAHTIGRRDLNTMIGNDIKINYIASGYISC